VWDVWLSEVTAKSASVDKGNSAVIVLWLRTIIGMDDDTKRGIELGVRE